MDLYLYIIGVKILKYIFLYRGNFNLPKFIRDHLRPVCCSKSLQLITSN